MSKEQDELKEFLLKAEEDAKVEEMIAKYGDLVKKLAWTYWKKLPTATKMWVEPEDLISEAYLCFVTAVKKYDAKRASKCTFVWWTVKNMLINYCVREQQGKRQGVTVSLDAAMEAVNRHEPIKFPTKYLQQPDENVKLSEALDALSHVYQQAGEGCKVEMRRWFGPDWTVRPRRSVEGKLWNAEFRYLAKKNRLSMNDCRLLLKGGVWLMQ